MSAFFIGADNKGGKRLESIMFSPREGLPAPKVAILADR
jgi:hypothetical protein